MRQRLFVSVVFGLLTRGRAMSKKKRMRARTASAREEYRKQR